MTEESNKSGFNLFGAIAPGLSSATADSGSILAEAAKAMQKLTRINQQALRADQQKLAAISKAAEKAGLHRVGLTSQQMLGAFCLIVRNTSTAGALEAYDAAAKAFFEPTGATTEQRYSVFVSAPVLGAELQAACRASGLKAMDIPPGFRGKLAFAEAKAIGENFAATVRIRHGNDNLVLVEDGVVVASVAAKFITPATAPVTASDTAPQNDDVSSHERQGADASADNAGSLQASAGPLMHRPTSASPSQRPHGSPQARST